MGRLIFLYTANGSAPLGSNMKWDNNIRSENSFVKTITTEGYYYLIKKMLDTNIIDDAIIIIESNRSPGYFDCDGIKGYVIPHITCLDKFLKDNDIIWARGGFRSWHDYLIKLQERNHWLLLYAANTGRERWPFWDFIFDDLNINERIDERGRLWLYFKKPQNEEIFQPIDCKKKYDVCIGASHIHDKKAQWRIVEALHKLKSTTGRTLKCVLPGSTHGGSNTRRWITPEILESLNIKHLGMIQRKELAKVINSSKVFCYLGGAGQGDRGPLESMACGTPLFIGPTNRSAPIVYNNKDVTFICSNFEDSTTIYKELLGWLSILDDKNIKSKTYNHYIKQNGINICVDFMVEVISFINKNPKSDKLKLRDYARSRKATIAYNI